MTITNRLYAAPTDPWDQAVAVLQTASTGPIATGLALVAILVGGLISAFGEDAAKRTLAGVIFGVGMAVGAVNFMSWLLLRPSPHASSKLIEMSKSLLVPIVLPFKRLQAAADSNETQGYTSLCRCVFELADASP
jgi:type IV secretory pathway VirB2 component (pilin)